MPMILKTCSICDIQFLSTNINQKFCSRQCSNKSRSKSINCKCLTCGKEFTSLECRHRKFCSCKCFRHTEDTLKKMKHKPKNFSERIKQTYIDNPDLKNKRAKNVPSKIFKKEKLQQIYKKRNDSLKKFYKAHPERIERIREQRLKQILPIKDTSIEIALQEELKSRNIEFIAHPTIGCFQPDIYIPSLNTVIFADGCYWHRCPIHGKTYNPNKWRDDAVNKYLEEKDYIYYRFWEHEIIESPKNCINKAVNFINTN